MIKENYNISEQLVLRSPLLPFEAVQAIDDRDSLRRFFTNPLLKEALMISSERLYKVYTDWLNNDELSEEEENRLVFSLMKYALRMGGRSTPFGVSAGVTVADLAKETCIVPESDIVKKVIKKARVDMNMVYLFAKELVNDQDVRMYLNYRVTSTLDERNDFYRYVEYKTVNGQRIHEVVKLERSLELDDIITSAGDWISFQDLVSILTLRGFETSESVSFVHEIIDSQILTTNLDPTLTGVDAFEYFVSELHDIVERNSELESKRIEQLLSACKLIIKIYRTINERNDDLDIEYYYSKAKEISRDIGIECDSDFFQVDSYYNFHSKQLSRKSVRSLVRALDVVKLLSRSPEQTYLDQFKNRFLSRYQDKKVPLLEALDPEIGVGFGDSRRTYQTNELIEGLSIGSPNKSRKIDWGLSDSLIMYKYHEALRSGSTEVVFDDSDFQDFEPSESDLADTFSSMFSVFEEDGIEKIELLSSGGASALQLIGRFTNVSAEINDIAKDLALAEKDLNEGKILAEIVHHPEARVGNVIYRSTVRDYEIEYLGNSVLDSDRRISVSDLSVYIKNNKLILWSDKLNKEIIPMLGCAHNYSANALPVYQFLGSLSSQFAKGNLNFTATSIGKELSFIPRMSYQNVVISPMTWRFVGNTDTEKFNFKKEGYDSFFEKWRLKNGLRNSIYLVEGDNKLYFDLTNEFHQFCFKNIIRKKNVFTITECLVNSETSMVCDRRGSYHNQFIASFSRKSKVQYNFARSHFDIEENIFPGDEWLFLKIYCGYKEADNIMTQVLFDYCESLVANGICEKWFFIRYSDEFPHLRLRVLLRKKDLQYRVVSDLNNLLIKSKRWEVQDIIIDTYKREVNRYGLRTMELTESLFYHDSRIVCLLMKNEGLVGNLDERWTSAILIINNLLEGFGIELDDRVRLVQFLSDGFISEFGGHSVLRKQLGEKYRKHRPDISALLNIDLNSVKIFDEQNQFLSVYKEQIIRDLENENIYILDFLGSVIHMTLNRLFDSNARIHELAVYFFLNKEYRSLASRRKQVEV